ncbi:MarR family transcriptional regulator [Paenibacillus psychroresistens]|uniref:MarR family transcriptional regulator n=1 Tax=Paenibacillus psychroresistens TaxID=1778678 RepID=A0A6B8RTV1_9BACL|nr:MarR family transcriptional regulator [Paenibacillus psychroresistens]QGQ98873.1 MarR family transcriptional regulator [Paenibacillus psychroresistens]
MSSINSERSQLIDHLIGQLKLSSTRGILFHQTLADFLGLNITDHKCLGFLLEEGPQTAGKLAELTGLTTGAVTGVIDRLEKAGYVNREKDPHDRRRVMIAPAMDSQARMGKLFLSLYESSVQMSSQYTDQELNVILRFITESSQMMLQETDKLKQLIETKPSE